MKLYQLGLYLAGDDAEPVRRFGPLFTDSEDDRATMGEVITGFNEDAAKDAAVWCIAIFPAELEAVSS
jgi:hypothetical protein